MPIFMLFAWIFSREVTMILVILLSHTLLFVYIFIERNLMEHNRLENQSVDLKTSIKESVNLTSRDYPDVCSHFI